MKRSHNRTITATVEGVAIRGTLTHVISKLEALGYAAERANDDKLMHTYFQAADHYKRELENANKN